MNRRDNVLDLVKAAFVVLTIKVTASSSVLIPWGSFVDNLCIVFAILVTLAKLVRLTLPIGKLAGLGFLSVFTLYTCISLEQYDLLITVITVYLLTGEDLEEYISLMLKIQVWLVIAHVAVSGCLSLTGFSERFWFVSNGRLRFNGGFVHSNVLSSYILSCVLMFAWKRFRRITPNQFGWMTCIMVLSYIMSRSRTGLLLNLFLLVILILTQNENKLATKLIDPALLLFPGLSALVFWAQKQYMTGSGVALLLDDLLTGRIKYAAYGYLRSGTTLLPRYLDYAASGVVSWTPEWNLNTFTFDCLYSFLLMQMGILWIVVISALFIWMRKKLDFRNKIFLLIWMLFSIVEIHGLNCFKFFPLLLISTLLSEKGAEDHSIPHD
jgi:hypothetical protein